MNHVQDDPLTYAAVTAWPRGPGETSALIRGRDWATHSLGLSEGWPGCLRTAVDLVLACEFPMSVLWGPDLIQIYNDGYLALMGSRHPAGMGQPTRECWPEVWHLNEPVYARIWQGQTLTFEDQLFPILRRGFLEEAYFTLCYCPLRDEAGSIAGVVVTVFETTKRMQAARQRDKIETALRESEERLRLALSAANGVGVWDWDVERDLLRSNPSLAAVYGVDLDRASEGAPLAEYIRNIHPEDGPRIEQAIAKVLANGGDYAEEHRLVQADGSVRWVAARGRCTLSAQGVPLRFSGVTTDVSDRKRIEEALRTTEKVAAVGRLASSIAHEINNPLETVTNLLYLMAGTADEQELRSYLTQAQHELARVAQITSHTLRFHQQSTKPEHVQVSELLDCVLALYQGRFANAGVSIERRFRKEDPILCRGDDLRQVFSNLIANGYDAMRTSVRRQLLVRTRLATDWRTGRSGVRMTIADTGEGISKATRLKMFDPFFSTKGIHGTGLGLWVSLGIVEKHLGSLTVRSSQDETRSGSVFCMFIPNLSAT